MRYNGASYKDKMDRLQLYKEDKHSDHLTIDHNVEMETLTTMWRSNDRPAYLGVTRTSLTPLKIILWQPKLL